MSVQQFCLRWNNHQPNFISVCSSLLHNGTLVDVTLAAEGRQLQAHKIVLSACSSYFQTLFTSNPCQHPIVILKDVQYDDLKTMVDFMYYGEVNVSQEQLPHILKTAEMLKIKGLAEMPTDPANLTKSESKSSIEQAELVGAGVVGCISGTGVNTAGGGTGSGADSLWGNTESQFTTQQQQQQQSHHHHQQQQQQHQQQTQQHSQHQQHHHQQSQTQTQSHHQLRRTPSPLGSGASPATRRKRLRKSSNNGSGDRNNSDEHNTSVDTGTGNLSLAQMSQLSFGNAGTGSGTVVGVGGHSLHASKIIKESVSTDDAHQDSSPDSLDDGHSHAHAMQIKPEVDIGNVQQSMPLDISGATTPSDHDAPNATCSQSQSSHSGLQWTVVDSNYPRFALSTCQSNIIGNSNNTNGGHNSNSSGGGNGGGGDIIQGNSNSNGGNGTNTSGDHQQQQQQHQQQQHRQQQQQNNAATSVGSITANTHQQQQQQQQHSGHIQMHYQNPYSPQIIAVNSLVSGYSQNLSTPTSPNESGMVQSVYSQGPTPTQSPVHQIVTTRLAAASAANSNNNVNVTANAGSGGAGGAGNSGGGGNSSGNTVTVASSVVSTGAANNNNNNNAISVASSGGGGNSSGNSGATNASAAGGTPIVVKRKRSVNPQGDENFIRALEAVRSGGIGFCKAARLYGVNNRTLWLEYKKRGYPISRPSIKSRVVKQENLSPSPTPTNEETTIENYEHINQTAINMQVPPTSDTPTPSLLCTPHTHPMGVMNFLDTRHMEFPGGIHSMSRQRYVDGAVNVNTAAMNLQSINFNSI